MSMLLTEAPTEEPVVYRVSVEQYERMAEVGIIPPKARVELINGVIVEMSPAGPAHGVVVALLHRELTLHLHQHAIVFDQTTFACGRDSLPEPDLVVAPLPAKRYGKRRANEGDALLIVEVADSSLRYDRTVKARLYGRHGIPEMWLVDVRHRRVHVYTDPKDDGYATTAVRTWNDVLVPTAFPDVQIPVSTLLDPLT